MNTHDIELPPLPLTDWYAVWHGQALHGIYSTLTEATDMAAKLGGRGSVSAMYTEQQTRQAQHAAIEADRKRAADWHRIADERAAEIVKLEGELDRKRRGEPVAWPVAKEDDANKGWLLDYRFLEQVEKIASQRTNYTTSMEAAEQVLIAAAEVLGAPQPAEPIAMSLDAAIAHAVSVAADGSTPCQRQHLQLAAWLLELREFRCASKQPAESVKGAPTYSHDMKELAAHNLRSFLGKASFSSNADKQAALNCVEVLEEKAEPVKVSSDVDDRLIDAADSYAEKFDGDDRQDIKTDVINAFYQGARYVHRYAEGVEPVKVPSDAELEKAWDSFEAEMARHPTDDELEEFMAQFANEMGHIHDDQHAEAARALLARYGQSAESVTPSTQFDDHRVQQVYKIICGDNHPPEGEHWDGYVSRLIVDVLFPSEPVNVPSAADLMMLAKSYRTEIDTNGFKHHEFDEYGFARALLARYGKPAQE